MAETKLIPDAYSVLTGTLAVITGGIVGELSERIVSAIEIRKWGLDAAGNALGIQGGGLEMVERLLQIFLQVAIEGIATKIVLTGAPDIGSSGANYAMFALGLLQSSKHLQDNLDYVNSMIFGALYSVGSSFEPAQPVVPQEPAQKRV